MRGLFLGMSVRHLGEWKMVYRNGFRDGIRPAALHLRR